MWSEDAPELPGFVLDSIKDSRAMSNALGNVTSPEAMWALDWVLPYLQSLWSSEAFSNVAAKVFVYLGEELQHSTQSIGTRVYAFKTLFHVSFTSCVVGSKLNDSVQALLALHHQAAEESNAKRQLELLKLCETHPAIITNVALGSRYETPVWEEPRSAARAVLKRFLTRDAEATMQCLDELCRSRRDLARIFTSRLSPPSPSSIEACSPLPRGVVIHKQLWKSVYDLLNSKHMDGIALVLQAVTRVAHVDHLRANADEGFSSSFLRTDQNLRSRFVRCVNSVWDALGTIRDSFGAHLESFADLAGVNLLNEFLGREGITEEIVQLMLCPVDSLNEAAKSLALNAYDTVERSACYKAFLERHPAASFQGLISYLTTFNYYAAEMPEACGTSKYLVRSMTEILSCLGDSTWGLLLDDDYGKSANLQLHACVPKLWKRMTDGLSIIFRLVKSWSAFYPYEEMVIWMRDALIFGRDMIAVVEVLQSATDRAATRVMSSAEKTPNLMADLCVILSELIEWLKLTDEETLHQSHELLKSLLACFASSKSEPPQSAIALLERYAIRAKGTRTQLDDSKLAELMVAMEPFLDQDVQIVQPPPKKLYPPKVASSMSNDEIEFLGMNDLATRKSVQQAHWKTLLSKKAKEDSKPLMTVCHRNLSLSFVNDTYALFQKANDAPTAAKMIKVATSSSSASGTPTVSKEKPSYKPIKAERPSDLAIQNYRKAQQSSREEIPRNGILAGPSFIPPVPLRAQPKPKPPEPERESSSSEEISSDDGNGAFNDIILRSLLIRWSLQRQMTYVGKVLPPSK